MDIPTAYKSTTTNSRTMAPAVIIKFPYPSDATVRCSYLSPLGGMTLAARGNTLTGVWFNGQKHQPDFSQWAADAKSPVLIETKRQLAEYFAGKRRAFELPLDLSNGTAFQQTVWQALLSIAPGKTWSYGEVGQAIGKPTAARAVGAAVGKNPLSIVVPCHRVVGSNGAITGYAGGVERKAVLLKLEKQDVGRKR